MNSVVALAKPTSKSVLDRTMNANADSSAVAADLTLRAIRRSKSITSDEDRITLLGRSAAANANKTTDVQSADSKKLKTSGETTEASSNHNGNQSEATIVEENGIAAKVSLNEESSKSSAVKREGNRRKSEPRRAAESSFIAGR